MFLVCVAWPLIGMAQPSFQEVFEQSSAVMLLIEPSGGQIVDANEAAASFYGWPRDALKGRTIQSINTLTPEQVAQERALALSERRPYFIFRHRLANEEVRTVKVRSTPFNFGNTQLLLSIITDITPGPQDEQAVWHFKHRLEEMVAIQTQQIEDNHRHRAWILGTAISLLAVLSVYLWISSRRHLRLRRDTQAAHNRLQATLQAVPDLLFELDAQHRFLNVHTSSPQDLLLPPDEFLGKPIGDVLPPEVISVVMLAFSHAQMAGVSSGHEYTLDINGQTRHYELSVAVKRGESGAIDGHVCTVRDITQRKQAETQLQLAASVFTHAREAIIMADAQGNIVDVNHSFSRITGYSRAEVLGRNPRFLKSGRHKPEFYRNLWQSLLEKGHWYGEMWNRHKNGNIFAALLTISAVRDKGGVIEHFVGLFNDITLQKEHQQELERVAHYDALTQLPNRVLLADRLRQAMARSQRSQQLLAVVFLDLDGFKAINDTHGHNTGDLLLVALAQRMKVALREDDTLARIGGDEFVAVLVGLDSADAVRLVLDRLLQAAAEPVTLVGRVMQVSASLGVTLYPRDAGDADQLMRHADQAMYQAKQAGKNRYHFFDVDYDNTLKSETERINRIKQALHGGELLLYFQPQVHLQTLALVGVEALLRWQHPTEGLLPPSKFLPLLQGKPFLTHLDQWVLTQAFEQLAKWQVNELAGIPIGVNISAASLQTPSFVQQLEMLQARYPQLPRGLLKLEVLETSALEDLAGSIKVIQACREIGVQFALDDFGTGYSSLTYLRRLPADQLKIDQSFVRDMLIDGNDRAIVQGVLGLARAFERQVIAEGVESQAIGQALLEAGCHFGQGYGIARPMDVSALTQWVAQWHKHPQWLK